MPTWLIKVQRGFLSLCIFLFISSLILFNFSGHWSTGENAESKLKFSIGKRKHNRLNCLVGSKRGSQQILLFCSFPPKLRGPCSVGAQYRNKRLEYTIWFQTLSEKLFWREWDWEVKDLCNASFCLAPATADINFASLHLLYENKQTNKLHSISENKRPSVGFYLSICP